MKLEIRWITLGALVLFLSVFAGEQLVTRRIEADPQGRAILEKAQRLAAEDSSAALSSNATMAERDRDRSAVRDELLNYLISPFVIVLAVLLLVMPFWVGVLMGVKTTSWGNAALTGAVGSLAVVTYLIRPESLSALLPCAVIVLFFTAETLGGSVVARIVRRKRMDGGE